MADLDQAAVSDSDAKQVFPSTGLETIDGHIYYVERDDKGNILRQEARDPITAPVIAKIDPADQAATLSIIQKKSSDVTTADVAALLQFIATKLIG